MSEIAAIVLAAGLASRYRAAGGPAPSKLVAEFRGEAAGALGGRGGAGLERAAGAGGDRTRAGRGRGGARRARRDVRRQPRLRRGARDFAARRGRRAAGATSPAPSCCSATCPRSRRRSSTRWRRCFSRRRARRPPCRCCRDSAATRCCLAARCSREVARLARRRGRAAAVAGAAGGADRHGRGRRRSGVTLDVDAPADFEAPLRAARRRRQRSRRHRRGDHRACRTTSGRFPTPVCPARRWLTPITSSFARGAGAGRRDAGGGDGGRLRGLRRRLDRAGRTDLRAADSNRYGYVSDICVREAFRGRGAASALLAGLEARLTRAGVTRLRLNVLAANAAARAAYEKAGFAPYECRLREACRPALTLRRAPTNAYNRRWHVSAETIMTEVQKNYIAGEWVDGVVRQPQHQPLQHRRRRRRVRAGERGRRSTRRSRPPRAALPAGRARRRRSATTFC